MARTDNDTWDLASSVGATATMVAAARAVASRADDPLIDDPFAEPLVRAVGVDFFTRMATRRAAPRTSATTAAMGVTRMTDDMAVRTTASSTSSSSTRPPPGVRQVVILASGLDSRAYRLDWPADTVVFEIDQPEVIEFKTQTLADLGAEPTADRRTVAIDLRDDWPAALRRGRVRPGEADGLERRGPARLPARRRRRTGCWTPITELCAPGSRFATEAAPATRRRRPTSRARRMEDASRRTGASTASTSISPSLVYLGERNEVTDLPRRPRLEGQPRSRINDLLGRPACAASSTTTRPMPASPTSATSAPSTAARR